MTVDETPYRALRHLHAVLPVKVPGDLQQRDIAPGFDQAQDLIGMDFDMMRPLVAALPARGDITCPLPLRHPFDRRRRRHAEALGSLAPGHPVRHRRNQTTADIHRKCSRHTSWPPSPACILNHKSRIEGILYDSFR